MSEETFYRNMALGTAAAALLFGFFCENDDERKAQEEQKLKQIMEKKWEKNKATLSFYRNMALGSSAASLLVNFIFFKICKVTVMSTLSLLILGAAYLFMVFMSEPRFSETGALLSSGTDLNRKGDITESAKDLIILTSSTMLLVIVSNYFWFLLLLAPISVVLSLLWD